MTRRVSLLLLAFTFALACSDTSGPGGIAGTWRLQTVNGGALPFVIPDENFDKLEITGTVFTFTAAGRFTDLSSFRITSGGKVSVDSITSVGTYALEGSTVRMTYDEDGSVFLAPVKGDTMTITDFGLTFLYRRD